MSNAGIAPTAAAVAEQGAHVAPEKPTSKKEANRKKGAPRAKKTAKANPKKVAKPAPTAAAPRAESKTAKILALIRRPKGATLTEIMKVADWRAHSVRGFISTAGKKHGIKIESSKNDAGDRFYRAAK
jgi:hypothetical protein